MTETHGPRRHPSSGPVARSTPPGRRESIVIVCDECVMQCTSTCDDCVVTYVLRADDAAPAALTLDVAEERVVRLLEQAGMIPALQYRVAM